MGMPWVSCSVDGMSHRTMYCSILRIALYVSYRFNDRWTNTNRLGESAIGIGMYIGSIGGRVGWLSVVAARALLSISLCQWSKRLWCILIYADAGLNHYVLGNVTLVYCISCECCVTDSKESVRAFSRRGLLITLHFILGRSKVHYVCGYVFCSTPFPVVRL